MSLVKPKYFLFENVASMKKADRIEISKTLGVEPIHINSNLVSAQDRNRLYWTNIPNVEQPKDKHIMLKDIIKYGSKREENFSENKLAFIERKIKEFNNSQYVCLDGRKNGKSIPVTARGYSAWNTTFVTDTVGVRDLTIAEYKKITDYSRLVYFWRFKKERYY